MELQNNYHITNIEENFTRLSLHALKNVICKWELRCGSSFPCECLLQLTSGCSSHNKLHLWILDLVSSSDLKDCMMHWSCKNKIAICKNWNKIYEVALSFMAILIRTHVFVIVYERFLCKFFCFWKCLFLLFQLCALLGYGTGCKQESSYILLSRYKS